VLHVLNGDATLRVFQQTRLPGDVLVWRDILVEGPAAPPAVRAPYLAERLGIDAQEYVAGRRQEAAALEGSADHDEVVLWFEQDLFCAVNLWFLLACASWRLALTALGHEVLARRRDWLTLHPLHRWLGGVHLHPEGPAWRWDAAHGRLIGGAR
jgi:hypothetical protein